MLAWTATTVIDRSASLGGLLLVAVLAGVFLPPFLDGWRPEPPRRFDLLAGAARGEPDGAAPVYSERFIDPQPSWPSLATPALGELANGDLLAVWKVGESDEQGRNVALHRATYDHRAGAWRPVHPLTSSRRTQRELGRLVGTLANPVLLTRRDGAVSLFYVTAWAKWSTSAIALKTSRDHGETWSPARRIVTNPVGNLATLVKTAPIHYSDGSIGLPAYHELFGVFPQLLRLSPEGELLDKVRIHRGQVSLQPSVVALDDRRALALMRNAYKGRILTAGTSDAGRHWGPLQAIDLPNPNAPAIGLRVRDGAILLAFNNSAVSRDHLSLALSRDGGQRWSVFHAFEEGVRTWNGALVNFSYPYLLQASDGMIHVVYVWRGALVKHVSFNEAWIRERAR